MPAFTPPFLLNLAGQIARQLAQSGVLPLLLVVVALVLSLDSYLIRALRPRIRAFRSKALRRFVRTSFWVSSAVLIASFISIFLYFGLRLIQYPGLMNLSMALFFLLLVPRLILVVVFLAEDLVRLLIAGFRLGKKMLTRQQSADSHPAAPPAPAQESEAPVLPGRRKFVSQLALGAAAIPFAGILYGVTKGKYDFTVRRVTLRSPELPPEFDGFSIVHISDLHTGSFDSHRQVQYGVDLIKDQGADLIAFTGDLVNNEAAEVEPWMKVFDQLRAKEGVFSILGNHDYGDYVPWPDEDAKALNLQTLKQHHASMGYRLLLNEHVTLTRGGASIALAGVENWGKPPFPQHGDLNKALLGTEATPFRILLSHDPSHWDAQVLAHPTAPQLTLSGHTHGMQFGIEIPGFRWSPVKYRYPRWAGVYEEQERWLYVNRGFGYLAFPGRVGIWPEITVIRLEKGEREVVEG